MFVLLKLCVAATLLLQIVWRVMHSYHQVKVWHDLYDVKSADSLSEYENQAEISFNRNYVKTKLANGLLRVWRVGGLISSVSVSISFLSLPRMCSKKSNHIFWQLTCLVLSMMISLGYWILSTSEG